MPDYDAIMIGANNHTLAAAGYLGKTLGFKCLILERRPFVGAAAMTKEIIPGFRFHCCATGYANYISKELIADLELDKYGVQMINLDPWLTSIFPDGKYVSVYESVEDTCHDFERFSKHDADSYRDFMAKWRPLTDLMGPAIQGPPMPFTALTGAMAMGPEMEEMLRDMLFMSLRRKLDEMYENDYIKCAYLSWLEGFIYPPSAPGSLFAIIGHLCMNLQWSVNKGGLGVISQALAKSAEHFGATIKVNTEVKKILVKNGKAYGVKLANGEEITASMVISGAEPQVTFLEMIGEQHFEPDFVRKVKHIWYEGAGCTLNFALNKLPDFQLPRERLKGFIGISPSLEYCEKAFYQRAIGEIPDNPIMIGYVLSEIDPTMAPPGKYLVTVYVFPLAYKLKKGNWDVRREELFEKTLNTLEIFAPNIKKSVIGQGGYTPLELERELHMTNGDHQHGAFEWGNLLGFRPIIGWTKPYQTPIADLYLCSAAAQLTGISGAVGHNVANMIIEMEAQKGVRKGKKGK